MDAAGRRCLILATWTVSTALIWQCLTVRYHYGGNWTALFFTGEYFPPPPALRAGTYVFRDSAGYDGQFYRYLAHDPFLGKSYAEYMDVPRVRCRRILVPLLAWALALGSDRRIDAVFDVVVLLSVFAGVWWCARWLALRGRSPAWGLLFVLTPAAIASIDRMLTDAALTAAFAAFLYYSETGRWRPVYLTAMAAMLVRETGALLVAAAVIFWALRGQYRRAALFATAALPALGWYAFVHFHTPPDTAPSPIWPFAGLLGRWSIARSHPDPVLSRVLQVIDLAALAGFAATLILTVILARRAKPGPARICAVLFAVVAVAVASPGWMIEAYSYGRPMSPLLLFVSLEAVASGALRALAAPLLVTASVAVMSVKPLVRIVSGILGRG